MTNTISFSAITSSTAISYVNTAHNYGVSGDGYAQERMPVIRRPEKYSVLSKA